MAPRKVYPIAPASVADAAATYAAAREAEEAAKASKADAAAALLRALQDANLECTATPSGKVTVSSGRRTVVVTCPALKAEIKAIEERAVRTGRAEERIGTPFPVLRS